MKAALFRGPEKGLIIGEKEKQTPRPKDVLVKVKCVSLCHSDFTLFDGEYPTTPYPVIPG